MEQPLAGTALCIVVAACMAVGWAGAASAHVIDKYWAVTGIADGDTLEIHEQPFSGSKVVADIPATASGLARGSCVTSGRQAFPPSSWCRVIYGGVQGWVDSRFLTPDLEPRLPMYAPATEPGQRSYRGFGPEFRRLPVSSLPWKAPLQPCWRLPDSDELILVCETALER